MPKNFFQDMVKIKNENKKKFRQDFRVSSEHDFSIDDVYVSNEAKESLVEDKPIKVYEAKGKSTPMFTYKKKKRNGLWFVAIISILFFIFSVSVLFLKVVVTVNPKIKDVVLNQNFSGSLNGVSGTLPFNLMILSGEENKQVSTTGQKDVLEKARGVVAMYNTFSTTAQRLDIDTRLEGSNGKIYKTEKKITVPGMIGSTPGKVEVGIYAAEAGEEYNSDPIDFKIFGFKGTPKYSGFFGRSTNSITGGFKGKVSIIPDEEKISVTNDLKETLQTSLFKKATEQIPSGFILFEDAVFLNVDDNNIDRASFVEGLSSIKMKGTLYGLLLDEKKLVNKIAENNIDGYDGSTIYIPDIRNLTFSLSSKDNASFVDVKNIDFNLKGNAKIVWKLDEDKLILDLLDKNKKDFSQILLKYPYIDSADLSISPFWKTSLPSKIKDIKIIVNYPK